MRTNITRIIIAALIIFGIFAVGMRLGYNKAIRDAKLLEVCGDTYYIGYGDDDHGYMVHEYTLNP